VWIRFYNPRGANTPEFDAVLSLGQAATTDLIITEVLQGFRLTEKKRYKAALNDLESCIYVGSFQKTIAIEAAENYRKLRGKGITPRNTIDVYLATLCIANEMSLLTYDFADFKPMAKALGLRLV
jgi:hypothetical protein